MSSENNITMNLLSWFCKAFFNRSSSTKDEEALRPAFKNQRPNSDNGAVLYIVSVLIFYSAAIVVMIIKYLNSEREEKNEEAMLEAFFKNMPTGKAEKEDQVNKVAIRAFHTLTTAMHNGYEEDDEDTESSSSSSSPQLLITDV